jgi:hypothetical protein
VSGMGVYVITTLRFLRHMGSVEWVTFHGPESHLRVGGGIEGEDSVVGSVDGARRVTIVAGAGRGVGAEVGSNVGCDWLSWFIACYGCLCCRLGAGLWVVGMEGWWWKGRVREGGGGWVRWLVLDKQRTGTITRLLGIDIEVFKQAPAETLIFTINTDGWHKACSGQAAYNIGRDVRCTS